MTENRKQVRFKGIPSEAECVENFRPSRWKSGDSAFFHMLLLVWCSRCFDYISVTVHCFCDWKTDYGEDLHHHQVMVWLGWYSVLSKCCSVWNLTRIIFLNFKYSTNLDDTQTFQRFATPLWCMGLPLLSIACYFGTSRSGTSPRTNLGFVWRRLRGHGAYDIVAGGGYGLASSTACQGYVLLPPASVCKPRLQSSVSCFLRGFLRLHSLAFVGFAYHSQFPRFHSRSQAWIRQKAAGVVGDSIQFTYDTCFACAQVPTSLSELPHCWRGGTRWIKKTCQSCIPAISLKYFLPYVRKRGERHGLFAILYVHRFPKRFCDLWNVST